MRLRATAPAPSLILLILPHSKDENLNRQSWEILRGRDVAYQSGLASDHPQVMLACRDSLVMRVRGW